MWIERVKVHNHALFQVLEEHIQCFIIVVGSLQDGPNDPNLLVFMSLLVYVYLDWSVYLITGKWLCEFTG